VDTKLTRAGGDHRFRALRDGDGAQCADAAAPITVGGERAYGVFMAPGTGYHQRHPGHPLGPHRQRQPAVEPAQLTPPGHNERRNANP
jgi:hypothetical protein